MHPLESLEVVQSILDHLSSRDQPMVREVAPAPGSRAKRFAQLLCPAAHPIEAATSDSSSTSPTTASCNSIDIEERIASLEREVKELRSAINAITHSLSAP